MNIIKKHIFLSSLYLMFALGITTLYAQTPQDTLAIAKKEVNQDDLGNVSDKFQEYFFKALAKRAVEDYTQAITILKECKALRPNEMSVDFELGKNYFSLNNLPEAEKYLTTALAKQPNNIDIEITLYDVFAAQKNYQKAIPLAISLSQKKLSYYEDLANLYSRTKKHEKALEALDRIVDEQGDTYYRKRLRNKLYNEIAPQKLEHYFLHKLEKKASADNYFNITALYLEQNNPEVTTYLQNMKKEFPDSPKTQSLTYAYQLKNNEIPAAVKTITTVVENPKTENELKVKAITYLVSIVKNHPEYKPNLLSILEQQKSLPLEKTTTDFLAENNNVKAIEQYEAILKTKNSDFQTLKALIPLYLKEKKYHEALKLSIEALSFYPTQGIFYTYQSAAYINLKEYTNGIESAELGLNFITANSPLKLSLYQNILEAYKALEQPEKILEIEEKIKHITK